MKNIRWDNDFKVMWIVKLDAETPIPFNGIYDESLQLVVMNRVMEISTFDRQDNEITFEVTPQMQPMPGIYRVEWYYKIPDESNYRGYLNRAIDAPVFRIVSTSAAADDIRNLTVTTILKR